jgi:hypothetical protein
MRFVSHVLCTQLTNIHWLQALYDAEVSSASGSLPSGAGGQSGTGAAQSAPIGTMDMTDEERQALTDYQYAQILQVCDQSQACLFAPQPWESIFGSPPPSLPPRYGRRSSSAKT